VLESSETNNIFARPFTITEANLEHCYQSPYDNGKIDKELETQSTWQQEGPVNIKTGECRVYKIHMVPWRMYDFSVCELDQTGGTSDADIDFELYDPNSNLIWSIDGESACDYKASTLGSIYEAFSPPTMDDYYLRVSVFQDDGPATFTLAYKHIEEGVPDIRIEPTRLEFLPQVKKSSP
ncbi:MAG: hypothetical protein GY790_24255, partial [Bacteroidetes bacterium]|nr:hypothetical protein [Bacteroidota bacterium]